jgi:hypothetical protein
VRIVAIVLLQVIVGIVMLVFLLIATCGVVVLGGGRKPLLWPLFCIVVGGLGFVGLLLVERALQRAK